MKKIITKRIYEKADASDGYRILVDRLWPRGVSKENAMVDEWLKELGPSNELRKWFGHIPEKYPEFKKKYKEELKSKTTTLERMRAIADKQQLCLCYGAKDTEHNQAQVLKEILEKKM
ncbi:MAG: DUF488 domain-containing protein [Weeksellaceae bacterium]|jgi:uncharacterized protein YeaO (DUF488 family)|nr:DUF488 domain-containing protein [Weeksellaceae bacterium]